MTFQEKQPSWTKFIAFHENRSQSAQNIIAFQANIDQLAQSIMTYHVNRSQFAQTILAQSAKNIHTYFHEKVRKNISKCCLKQINFTYKTLKRQSQLQHTTFWNIFFLLFKENKSTFHVNHLIGTWFTWKC